MLRIGHEAQWHDPIPVNERPVAIMVVAWFLYLATAIAALVGVLLLFPNSLLDRLWELNPAGSVVFHAIGRVSCVFLLALGCATFLAARGLLRGRWAWWFAVTLFATDVTGDLVSFLYLHDALRTISGAIVSAGFLYLLFRREVRAYPVPRS